MASNRPRTFAELVTALEPEERARLEHSESYDDPAVAEAFLRQVTVLKIGTAAANGGSNTSMMKAAAT